MQAYLVIREGTKWSDVFRLAPGQSVTVGRAPTNQIVVKDDRCSRNHAEIFFSQGEWTARDLGSRNGTLVNGQLIEGDYVLEPGDTLRIGRASLAYVNKLSEAFADSPPGPQTRVVDDGDDGDASVLTPLEPTTITHRRGKTRFFEQPRLIQGDESGIANVQKAAANLCRLSFDLGQATNQGAMAKLALEGLFEGAGADTAAVLLKNRGAAAVPLDSELDVTNFKSLTGRKYHRISPVLSSTVLREGEAILARNIADDSNVISRDSTGPAQATSVICAPIRLGETIFGLVHLYSVTAENPLVPDDLEYTLAVADALAVALNNLSRRQDLTENLLQARHENIELRQRLGVQSEIIGSSEVVSQVTEQIARAAATRATVLIRGESGVGKELVARAIHFTSARRKGTFVCLNCAALSETLLESELFGHERGAFTGATERKVGKFEAAHQGTIMLDEIGEMSQSIQAKFLRVLEGHPFERVGGSEPVKVDVRVIAATNRDLEVEVQEKRFRRDLYFRLRVLDMYVPPLRKRVDDIPVLTAYFLRQFTTETGRKLRGFTDAAMEQMKRYRWPGNVRELRNVVERAVVLARRDIIDTDDLMLSKVSTAGDTNEHARPAAFEPLSLADMEARQILATLEHTNWNKSQTANILGIERSTLDRKIRRYELLTGERKRGGEASDGGDFEAGNEE